MFEKLFSNIHDCFFYRSFLIIPVFYHLMSYTAPYYSRRYTTGFGELFIKISVSHKSVLWSRTVGDCSSNLKIKDVAIFRASENENLILVQKCLGKKWFLADKRKLELQQGGYGPISFTTCFMYFSNSLSDLLWNSLLKFKTLSSVHHSFSSLQLAPYLCPWKRTCWPATYRQALGGEPVLFLIFTALVLIQTTPH